MHVRQVIHRSGSGLVSQPIFGSLRNRARSGVRIARLAGYGRGCGNEKSTAY